MSKKQIKNRFLRRISVLSCVVVMLLPYFPSPFPVQAKETDGSTIIVSLGDSYSSGEGIEPFYGQEKALEDKVKDTDWLAHRSQHSWPGMLKLPSVNGAMAENRNTSNPNWYFAAVSGAKTVDIIKTSDYDTLTDEEKSEIMIKAYFKTISATASEMIPTSIWNGKEVVSYQLDIFEKLGDKKADYVTVTIGGNDVGFSDIVKKMAVGSLYIDWLGLENQIVTVKSEIKKGGNIYNKLINTYARIANTAGPQAHIIVAGYPILFDPKGSDIFLSEDEVELVNGATIELNNAIESIVRECDTSGINIEFVPVVDAFIDHGAYSDDPYLNEIMLGAQKEDINDYALSSSYSVHPNDNGARAYAKCVQTKINELEGLGLVEGNIYEIINSSENETIVPALNAQISIYSHVEKRCIETFTMTDEEGFFERFLPFGEYSIAVEADGYISQTTSFKLTNVPENISIQLSPKEITHQTKPLTQVNIYHRGELVQQHMLKYSDDQKLVESTVADLEMDAETTYTYTYDDSGRLLEANSGDSSDYLGNDEYVYNDLGQLISYRYYWGGSELPYHQYDYEYDSQGRVTSESFKMLSYGEVHEQFLTSVSKFKYDANGNIVEKAGTYVDGGDTETTTYTYDSEGRLLSEQNSYNPNNYSYEYAPFVLATSYDTCSLLINDIMGHEIWSIGIGDSNSNIITDDEGYIISIANKETGYSYEFIYDTEEEQPESEEPFSLSLYRDVIQQAIRASTSEGFGYGDGKGTFIDLNGDGNEELLMYYSALANSGDGEFDHGVCSLYTTSNGEVIPLLEKEPVFMIVDGLHGYVGAANVDGRIQLFLYESRPHLDTPTNKTSGPVYWDFYTLNGTKLTLEDSVECFLTYEGRTLLPDESSAKISGQKVSSEQYQQWESTLDVIGYIDIYDLGSLNGWTSMGIPLEDLYAQAN